jgi:CBS domain-containing protein
MKFFYYAFLPGIIVFNGTANYFTSLVGVSPASESEETHSEEEIRMILTRSEETGHIDVDEVEMIESVFELGDTIAREVMVPRPDVETVPASLPLAALQSVAATGPFTRYLVLDDDGEQPIGFVHAKDVLRAIEADVDRDEALLAEDLAREVLVVPETRRIDDIPIGLYDLLDTQILHAPEARSLGGDPAVDHGCIRLRHERAQCKFANAARMPCKQHTRRDISIVCDTHWTPALRSGASSSTDSASAFVGTPNSWNAMRCSIG